MAISDEIREQTVKLKDMTFKQKAAYIWEYYKWWIVGVIVAVIFIVSFVRTILSNGRPMYITVTFINSVVGFSEDKPNIEQEFIDEVGVDTDTYNTYFDYSLRFDGETVDQTTYTSQVKLMAQYAAHELDVVCAPESVIDGPASPGGYSDFVGLLPDGMMDELSKKGYEPFYYTEVIDDHEFDDMEPETITYIAGIYMDKCDYLFSGNGQGIYEQDADDRIVLVIAPGSENVDHAIEFIKFVTR